MADVDHDISAIKFIVVSVVLESEILSVACFNFIVI